MRNLKQTVLGIALVLALSGLGIAQATASHTVTMNVQAIARIAVTANVVLDITAPVFAGDYPADDTDNTAYLQYTVVVSPGQTKNVTAAWASGDTAPAGCELWLTATPQVGGNRGSSAGQIIMSDSAQPVITGIGSCATGRGAGQGAMLTYTLHVSDFTALVAGETQVATVTFTLIDA